MILNNTYVLLKKIDNMIVLNLSGTGTCKQVMDTIGTLAAAYRPSFQIYGCIMIFDSANTRYAGLLGISASGSPSLMFYKPYTAEGGTASSRTDLYPAGTMCWAVK